MSHTPDIVRIAKRGVDAKTTGATQIGTTDNGTQRFVPLFATVEITSATLLTVAGAVSIGTNATNYDDIMGITTLTGLTAVNKMLSILLPTPSSIAVNTAMFVKVTTGVVATAATMDVHLVGFYQ